MKITVCLAVALLLLAIPFEAFPQGSLTPPGPPAPVMHTLEQIFQTESAISNSVHDVVLTTSNIWLAVSDLDFGGVTNVILPPIQETMMMSTGIYVQVLNNQSYLGMIESNMFALAGEIEQSRILNRPMTVKIGSTNAVYFKTASGVVATLSVSSSRGTIVVNSAAMTEIGTDGIYVYEVVLNPGWGIGEFTVQCRNTSYAGRHIDRAVMQVVAPDYWTDSWHMGFMESILTNVHVLVSDDYSVDTQTLALVMNAAIDIADNEPRTPISSIPYSITQSGSYYLTSNLSSVSSGVLIQTNDVTVDLNGYTMSQTSGAVAAGAMINGVENVTVRNGVLRNFYFGLAVQDSENCLLEGIKIVSSQFEGLKLTGASRGTVVRGCQISGSVFRGIQIESGADGNTIRDCSIQDNAGDGIRLDGGSGQCRGNLIRDCTISANTDCGIYLINADGNRIENNHISLTVGSDSYGILTTNSTGNLIVRNTCVGQTNNFVFSENDTYGPVAIGSGELSSTGKASHAWANFSF